MKILVTGGAGFIGSHTVDALIARGQKVAVVDDLSSGFRRNLNPKAKFYCLNIQSPKIWGIFKKEKFSAVYHFAAQKDVRKSVADPRFDAQSNILGSLNLLEAAVKTEVKKFIFASTGGAIYGEAKKIPTPENYLEQPVSPYGIAKLAIEKYLYYYRLIHQLDYVALRYANVYGPRQDPFGEAGVVAIFSQRLLTGQQPVINGTGKQTRDYINIADVVKANLLVLKPAKSSIYNIGTGKEISVNQLLKKMLALGKFNQRPKFGPAKEGEQKRSALEIRKAKKELNWQPEITLEQGLKLTINWFRQSTRPLDSPDVTSGLLGLPAGRQGQAPDT